MARNPKKSADPATPAEQPQRLRISQVAQAAGVSKQTIEYYCLLGLLEPERDTKTRRRIFLEEHVKRVKLIKSMNQTGYTLRDIREIWLKDK